VDHTEVAWEHKIDTNDLLVDTTYKEACLLRIATEVDLRGMRFNFLCGEHMYFALSRIWRGNCAIVAGLPNIVYCKIHKMVSLG
jgi:hypothetical protein